MIDLHPLLPNDPGAEFIKTLITEFAKSIYKKISSSSKGPKKEITKDKVNDIDEKITALIVSMYKWSTESQFFGTSVPISISNSVALTISFNLREYTEEVKYKKTISEQELFQTKGNFLIYGDPGSGKTTTLKRILARNFFSVPRTLTFSHPYLVKLKDIPTDSNLYVFIAEELGFKVEYKVANTVVKKLEILRNSDGTHVYKDGAYQYREIEQIIEKKIYFVNDEPIARFITNYIEEANLFVAMDGLDELPESISSEVQKQIEEMGSHLMNSKIVVTCRPAYLEKRLQSFVLTEIAELGDLQIKEICDGWIDNSNDFLSLLKTKSYFDLSTKPLFLSYLLVLYKGALSLPDSAKEVYEEIINFYLVKWDLDNGVKRSSKYSSFKTSQKKEFLSHLAFYLTYKTRSKSFTTANLEEAYKKIYRQFRLPSDEAASVASEIQTHTGIIVKAFFNKYEFSHLSIQEHLCAHYIVRESSTPLILEYLAVYPSPLALVISHAPNPSNWFARIALGSLMQVKNGYGSDAVTRSMSIIVNRVILENPYFDRSVDLGFSILYMTTTCNIDDESFFDAFRKFIGNCANVLDSMIDALVDYQYFTHNKARATVVFKRKYQFSYNSQFDIDNLERIAVPSYLYEELRRDRRLLHYQLPA